MISKFTYKLVQNRYSYCDHFYTLYLIVFDLSIHYYKCEDKYNNCVPYTQMDGQKSIQMLIYTCGQTDLTNLNKLDWGVDNYFFWEVLRRKMACLWVCLKSECDK